MYIKKTWKAGRTIEVKKTYSARFGKKIPRAGNISETSAAQEMVNRKNAIDELRRILNANFVPGDWHATFTYPMKVPPTKAKAKHALQVFLRRLRELYRRYGSELKYVHVTEFEYKRIHHHMVLPDLPGGMKPVRELWKGVLADLFYTQEERERKEPQHLRFPLSQLDDSGNYGLLAEYLIKETERTRKTPDAFSKRRYCCSRNMVHPQPVIEIIHAKEYRKDPPQRKGFYIDERCSFNGVSESTGLPMQETVYVKLTATRERRRL